MSGTAQPTGRRYGGRGAAERQQERRSRLVDAGLEVFGTVGYAAASVRQLCREAGLTERYFYESFQGREELLRAVYDRLIEEVETAAFSAAEAAGRAVGGVGEGPARTADRVPGEGEGSGGAADGSPGVGMGGEGSGGAADGSPGVAAGESRAGLEREARAGLESFVKTLTDDGRKARVVLIEVVGVSPAMEQRRHAVMHEFADFISALAARRLGIPRPELLPMLSIALVGGVNELLVDRTLGKQTGSVEEIVEVCTLLFVSAYEMLERRG
ncbi:TetR family transcriptional regulator [Streptomyces sp. NPDC003023]|uniref:TetR/AcrR family transcriptional regulator n=1 Tax=Streptomyces sp. NPDC003023 TaxID=3364675 RepID=UPI0036BDBCC7